jgi:hypothetical protein
MKLSIALPELTFPRLSKLLRGAADEVIRRQFTTRRR